MPVPYQIPPWVGQPADPAAHYAQGIQIGTRIGAEQAANQFQYNQMLLQQQKQEFESQLQQEKVNLSVADAIRTHQAQNAYAQLIGQGMTPEQALMVAGPAMGESVNELLRTQAMREQRGQMMGLNNLRADIALMNAQTMASRAEEQRKQDFQRNLQAQANTDLRRQLAEKTLAQRKLEYSARARDKINKDQDLVKLGNELIFAKADLENAENHWTEARREAARAKARENIKKTEAAITKKRQELFQQYQIDNPPPDATAPELPVEQPQEGDEGPGEPVGTVSEPPPASTNRVLRFVPGQGFQPVQ